MQKRILISIFAFYIIWQTAIGPFIAEIYEFQAMKANRSDTVEKNLKKAVRFDPENSLIQFSMAELYRRTNRVYEGEYYLDRSIYEHNGDLTPYAMWYYKGLYRLMSNDLIGAYYSFKRSIGYNARYKQSLDAKNKVEDALMKMQQKTATGKNE